jgi:hypothetical protein
MKWETSLVGYLLVLATLSSPEATLTGLTWTVLLGRCRSHTPRETTELPRTTHIEAADAQNPEAICCYWWRITDSEMVGIPGGRDVQDSRQDIPRDSSSQALRRLPIREPLDGGDVQPPASRRVRQRKGRPGRRVYTVSSVLVLDDRQQPERALEVEATAGGQVWATGRWQGREHPVERH